MIYFTIDELTKSCTAERLGIDNTPNECIKFNLEQLVKNVLDPLRMKYGQPIIVCSGYRCAELNKVVGGAGNSQHMKGQAVDIKSLSYSRYMNKMLAVILIAEKIPFDQLILEKVDNKGLPQWLHVSYSPNPRREILLFDGKKYQKVEKI